MLYVCAAVVCVAGYVKGSGLVVDLSAQTAAHHVLSLLHYTQGMCTLHYLTVLKIYTHCIHFTEGICTLCSGYLFMHGRFIQGAYTLHMHLLFSN